MFWKVLFRVLVTVLLIIAIEATEVQECNKDGIYFQTNDANCGDNCVLVGTRSVLYESSTQSLSNKNLSGAECSLYSIVDEVSVHGNASGYYVRYLDVVRNFTYVAEVKGSFECTVSRKTNTTGYLSPVSVVVPTYCNSTYSASPPASIISECVNNFNFRSSSIFQINTTDSNLVNMYCHVCYKVNIFAPVAIGMDKIDVDASFLSFEDNIIIGGKYNDFQNVTITTNVETMTYGLLAGQVAQIFGNYEKQPYLPFNLNASSINGTYGWTKLYFTNGSTVLESPPSLPANLPCSLVISYNVTKSEDFFPCDCVPGLALKTEGYMKFRMPKSSDCLQITTGGSLDRPDGFCYGNYEYNGKQYFVDYPNRFVYNYG